MHANDAVPLNIWSRWWRAERRADKTLRSYRSELDRLAARVDVPLLELDRLTIEDYVLSRADDGGVTSRMAYRAVRSFYGWAHQRELIEHDPTVDIPAPKEHVNPSPPTATAVEVARLIAAIKPGDPNGARDAAFISVLWATGCRRGEVVRMELQHVDLDAGTVLIPLTKTGQPRIVALTAEATERLVAWLERRYTWKPPTDHVWLSKSQDGASCAPMTTNAARLMFERRRHAAGLHHLTPHSLRRGWAVHAVRAGVSQVSVERLGGWASGSPMVARYTRALGQDLALEEAHRLLG